MLKLTNTALEKLIKLYNQYGGIFCGVDTDGDAVFIKLDEMPHILISGTTGSGKSVLLNSIICSLLKSCKKYSVVFTMIDTKRVELSPYKDLNENIREVATDEQTAIKFLRNVCDEIDGRYTIMEQNRWRKIPDDWHRKVVVIEELGDLMFASKKQVEQYIVKIARLGRACGVHLILATQRATTNIVTGEIKANIGCRFVLQTTSYIDSINILGYKGAETLKGKGDCLLKLPYQSIPIHIQCVYIDDETIDKIINEY